jgi:ElaB/YqjD/DUF883 family membrane-anchored ribosome-binding protein
MNKHEHATVNDMGTLVEDARALIAATADVAGEKVSEARKRLAAALDSAKEIAGRVRDQAVEGAQAADKTVRENVLIKPSASPSVWGRSSAIWPCAGAPAIATDSIDPAVPLVRRHFDLLLAVFNFTPVPRHGYRVGVPRGGYWKEVLNSDAQVYGGSNQGNSSGVDAAQVK